jgi:hypothetical protein
MLAVGRRIEAVSHATVGSADIHGPDAGAHGGHHRGRGPVVLLELPESPDLRPGEVAISSARREFGDWAAAVVSVHGTFAEAFSEAILDLAVRLH